MKKKALCMFASVILGFSTLPTVALASEPASDSGFQQTEKEAFAAFVSNLMTNYSKGLENYETALKGSYGEFTFTLGDAGRSMLSMMVPTDVSWIKDLKMTTDVSLTDGQTKEIMNVLLNDTQICTMEVWSDMKTMDTYIRIPELSESYITIDYTQAMASLDELEDAVPEGETDIPMSSSSEELMAYFSSYETVLQNLPDADLLGRILNNYSEMAIDGFTEGESGTETITVDDISQECTTYEGTMNEDAVLSVCEDLFSSARDDADIKSLFPEDSQDVYQDFQDAIDSLLEDLSQAESEETSAFSSKIWTDSEGDIVGRQFSLLDDSGSTPFLTWQAPKSGQDRGLLLELDGGDGTVLTLSGSGTVDGSTLNGSYTMSVYETPFLSIEVADYDTEAAKIGNINGVYTLSVLPKAISDDLSYAAVSNFRLVLDLASDGVASSYTADLQSGGASLCSLNFSADLGDGADLPALSEVKGTMYDSLSEEDMNAYMEEINVDTIMNNLTAAGMPDTFIEDIIAMSSGSYYDDYYEDPYSDSYEDDSLSSTDSFQSF